MQFPFFSLFLVTVKADFEKTREYYPSKMIT